jgi:HlyD family secretion protein
MSATNGASGFSRGNWRWGLAIVAIFAAGGLFARSRFRPVPVVASAVVRGKAVDAVYATGTVETEERVQVKAKTNGSIAEILVKSGQTVQKGELLARIDNPAVSFELKRGKADFGAASAQASKDAPQIAALRAERRAHEAELATVQSEYARTKKLVDSGSIPASELERIAAKVAQVEAQMAANDAKQKSLRIDLNAGAARAAVAVDSLEARVADTDVRAPMDGVVLAKNIEVGEVVSINQTLFKIGDTKNLILEVSIDEADVGRVRDGEKGSIAAVSLYAFNPKVFSGRVFDIGPDADRARKSFLAKIRLDTPPVGLRSGMSAEVNIVADEHAGALLMPSEADINSSVFRIESGRVHKVPVKLGIRDLLRIEVLEGLSEGDIVVVEGQDKIDDGKRVDPTIRISDPLAPMPDKTQPTGASLK